MQSAEQPIGKEPNAGPANWEWSQVCRCQPFGNITDDTLQRTLPPCVGTKPLLTHTLFIQGAHEQKYFVVETIPAFGVEFRLIQGRVLFMVLDSP